MYFANVQILNFKKTKRLIMRTLEMTGFNILGLKLNADTEKHVKIEKTRQTKRKMDVINYLQ